VRLAADLAIIDPMARSKRVPSGGVPRRKAMTEFGQRFEIALARARNIFPTKKSFLLAADIDPSQFNRYCTVDGTIPNIEQVRAWAVLLRCRMADLFPDEADGGIPGENPDIERVIVDAACTADEAAVLRSFANGPVPINYVLALGLLDRYRNAASNHGASAANEPPRQPSDGVVAGPRRGDSSRK
jgi:hypothetical protein